MKQLLLFFVLSFSLVNSQTIKKIKIADAETGKVIPNARIILANQIFYSNDDGFISLPKDAKQFYVSIAGYESLKSAKYQSTIKLKPLYNDIEEVKIVSIDVKKIFKEVLNNYSEIYYNKPAVYDITYSQKSFENEKMKSLMIADGKYWVRDGKFNGKEAFNGKHANFVQLQIDTLRYFKTEPNDFNIKVKEDKGAHDGVGNFFFNYELQRMNSLSKKRNAITTGRLVYEDELEQHIFYQIKTDADLTYNGTIIFNKKDRAITNFEMVFNQSSFKPKIHKDENGKEYERQSPNGKFVFDFYKVGDQYVPSKVSIKYDSSKFTQDENVFEFRSAREIVFKNFKEGSEAGLEKSVEINSAFWRDMKVSADKGELNLSKEELKFINDGNDEN